MRRRWHATAWCKCEYVVHAACFAGPCLMQFYVQLAAAAAFVNALAPCIVWHDRAGAGPHAASSCTDCSCFLCNFLHPCLPFQLHQWEGALSACSLGLRLRLPAYFRSCRCLLGLNWRCCTAYSAWNGALVRRCAGRGSPAAQAPPRPAHSWQMARRLAGLRVEACALSGEPAWGPAAWSLLFGSCQALGDLQTVLCDQVSPSQGPQRLGSPGQTETDQPPLHSFQNWWAWPSCRRLLLCWERAVEGWLEGSCSELLPPPAATRRHPAARSFNFSAVAAA